jgi:GT2 family glycosyltransferase
MNFENLNYMPDLSIIIVCYKGWERLNKCLEALDTFTGVNFKTEVIIVDNRSDDETVFEIEKKFSKFRFIFNTINGGFANGSNLGAKNAFGEFLLFLNPDTVASESEVEKLLNVTNQNGEFTLVSCKQINEKGKESIASGEFPSITNLTGLQRAIFNTNKSAIHNLQAVISFPDWISGSVMMIRKKTFSDLGGFDEDFWMYFEDVDLCKRIRNENGKIAICNFVTIEHNHGGSSRINIKTTALTKTEVHISRHVFISKNMTGFEKLIIQIFLVINNLISGGIMAILGLVLFFIPKLFSRTLSFLRLISYYGGSLTRLSWISPRSSGFLKK